MRKKPDDDSKLKEKLVADLYIVEYNIIGAKYENGEISKLEWEAFEKEWESRFHSALHNVVKQRVYIDDIEDEQ